MLYHTRQFWSKWTFKQGLRKVKKLLKQIFTKYVSFLLHLRFSSTQQVWKNFLLAVTPSPKFFWIYKTLFQQSKSHLGNIKNLTNSLIHNSWSRTTWLAINFAIKMSGDGRKFNFHYIPHFFCKALNIMRIPNSTFESIRQGSVLIVTVRPELSKVLYYNKLSFIAVPWMILFFSLW